MEKYIHYCWFGDAKPSGLAKKCIKSWKKYLPDYEIIEWNEENFDVNITKFSKSAYEAKRWAFVSDVARVYALKKMGGIYFDTDMMITIKSDDVVGRVKVYEQLVKGEAVDQAGVPEKDAQLLTKYRNI